MCARLTTFGCVALLALSVGCAPRVRVHQHGLMHDVLSSDSAASKPGIALAEIIEKPGAIAIGALASLKGEVTILDGKVWIARPDGAQLAVAGPLTETGDRAVLLTYANVARWQEIELTEGLAGEALEKEIRHHAQTQGIDVSRPFPFVIEGSVQDLQLHVINGTCPMRPGVELAADEQPWRGTFKGGTTATIIGFYAADSVGKMTHPGTSIHAHALLTAEGRTVTGHIERLAVARGAVLKLPAGR